MLRLRKSDLRGGTKNIDRRYWEIEETNNLKERTVVNIGSEGHDFGSGQNWENLKSLLKQGCGNKQCWLLHHVISNDCKTVKIDQCVVKIKQATLFSHPAPMVTILLHNTKRVKGPAFPPPDKGEGEKA